MASRHNLLAVTLKRHGASRAGFSHNAPVVLKSPIHDRLAMSAVEVLMLNSHGQGSVTFRPRRVSGQVIFNPRFGFPSGDSKVIVSSGQRSLRENTSPNHILNTDIS